MGLADELAKYTGNLYHVSHQRCGVSQLWDALDDRDREALASILGNSVWRGTKIVEFLRDCASALDADESNEKIRALYSGISPATVQRHRRGACACGGLA